MTLYLKYRPKNLDELDEVSVSESLKKIVTKKNIPHAFLFAGPKGTGKTSAARILAKIINCEDLKDGKPCDKCKQCTSITNGSNLDVVEMDAASHRGIDDVRILRDAVKLTPVSAKKKIYIIDEVHMLTTEASNALLKTLEEPPEHVVFILATTNPEKLIETIRSRTMLIPFKKATSDEIIKSLRKVAGAEKIKIDDESLKLVAEAADGSFRDAIKILEQLTVEETDLTKDLVGEFLFRNKTFDLDNFIGLFVRKDAKALVTEVENMSSKGVAAEVLLDSLIKRLRDALLAKIGVGENDIKDLSKEELIDLIVLLDKAFNEIGSSPIEQLPVELAIIKWCGETEELGPHGSNFKEDDEKKSENTDSKLEIPDSVPQDIAQPIDPVTLGETLAPEQMMNVGDGAWKSILDLVKPVNASMEALLRAAKPMSYNGKVLTLGVYYKFHKERIEEAKHRKILEEIVGKVLQSPTKVCCLLVEPPNKKVIEEAKSNTVLTEGKDQDMARVAEEIFGN